MSSTKSTESLKDSECEKGQLAIRPPISYVPPTDLHSSTESETIKVKLPDGTTVSVKAFSSGNNEDYILHWAAIFRLFEQKGLKSDVEVRAKLARDQMGVLEDIQKSLSGSAATGKKKTPTDAEKLELEGTEKLVSEAKAEFLKAVLKPFDLVRQLLIGEARTQWDKIVKEMFDRDTWTGVNGKTHDGPRLRTWKSLMDCIELHKLTVLPADAAEKQRFYVQQVVRKPQRVTIRQYMSRMGVLNDYIAHLPSIFYSSKAVASTVKGNVIFGDGELASIILASTPQTWQNQYNLTHSTVPESPRALLPDLENIERVMNERYAEKQKAKGKSKLDKPDGGGNPSPKKRSSGGSSERVPKKVRSEKFCQRCKTHGGPHQTHNTSDCRKYDKDGKPLGTAPGKPSDAGKPHKKFGGDKQMAYMTAMFESIQKGLKKQKKGSKKRKKRYDSSSSDSDSE